MQVFDLCQDGHTICRDKSNSRRADAAWVPSAQITKRSHGGIDDYSPTEANRQTKVMLHIK